MLGLLGIGGADSGVDVGDIGHSLRFRSAVSANMTKTPASAGNRQVWTYSTWVKRGALSADMLLLDAGVDGNNESAIWLNTSNQLDVFNYTSAVERLRKVTNIVSRDPTAAFHLVVSSNSSTSFRIYVNGVEVTSFSTDTGTNGFDWFFNHSDYTMHIGKRFNSTKYFDGYLSRVCFVDGQALDPTSFGRFNTTINEWVSKSQSEVKAVVDAGGANSFMLDFDDATSLTTLGYDKSSKGNNWTLNNFSLTAGSTYDHMLDVPGNSFATLNPLGAVLNRTLLSLSDGNLKAAGTSVLDRYAESTLIFGTAKCVAEATLTAITSGNPAFGVISDDGSSGAVYFSGGEIYVNGGFTTPGASYTANDTIRCEVDPVSKTVEFFKNNTSIRQLTLNGTPTVFSTYAGGVSTWAINFGQAPLHASATYHSAAGGYFRDAPSAGFKALCQSNMAEGTITTSGSFTGNAAADGPVVNINGVPTAMTINGNAVTFGTHADALSNGFKLRTASSSYNSSGSNTYSITSTGPKAKYALARGN